MADAIVEIVGQDDLPVITELFNQIYRPAQDIPAFKRRLLGRYNTLQMIARVGDRPVGFFLGYELTPSVYFTWHYGVLPDFRKQGIASQLMEAVHEWAQNSSYDAIRLETPNSSRAMLRLAIAHGYDIVGIRHDSERGDNQVLFEKSLSG